MKNILVLCTGNSCRSQIAHGFLAHYALHKARIYSAGIETHGVNPLAIATMAEIGIDISNHTSNCVSEYYHLDFDLIITVCNHAQQNCPIFPSKALRVHQNFLDPANAEGSEEEIRESFRKVREEIREFSKDILRNQLLFT